MSETVPSREDDRTRYHSLGHDGDAMGLAGSGTARRKMAGTGALSNGQGEDRPLRCMLPETAAVHECCLGRDIPRRRMMRSSRLAWRAVLLRWACASLQFVGAPTDEERAVTILSSVTRVDTSAVGDCDTGSAGKQCASLLH